LPSQREENFQEQLLKKVQTIDFDEEDVKRIAEQIAEETGMNSNNKKS